MKKPRFFFVEYNGTFIAQYKTIRGALGFISRKKLQDDYDNSLKIFDNNGEMYNKISGKHIEV
jgi:hypothetical protein